MGMERRVRCDVVLFFKLTQYQPHAGNALDDFFMLKLGTSFFLELYALVSPICPLQPAPWAPQLRRQL